MSITFLNVNIIKSSKQYIKQPKGLFSYLYVGLKKKYRDGCISTIGNIRKVSTNSYTKIQAGKNLEEGGKNDVISPQYVYQDTKLDKVILLFEVF